MPHITREDDIDVLPMSNRSLNCLHRAGIHTVGAMMDYPINEFINIRSMGQKTFEEIQALLQTLVDGTDGCVLVKSSERTAEVSQLTESSVAQDTVDVDGSGTVVKDIAIEKLQLSVRAKNSLTNGGFEFASQLVGITYDELINLRNMGKKTAEEVLAYLNKFPVPHSACLDISDTSLSDNELAAEMYATYGGTNSAWLKRIFAIKAEYPTATSETFIYRLYDNLSVRKATKTKILRILKKNKGEISKASLAECLPKHLTNTTVIEEILLELETEGVVKFGEVMIYRQYPSVVEFAAQISNERIREIIQRRLEGKTLNEIGECYGITRERVRQLMQKGLLKKPFLREDTYKYMYNHYNFSLEDFTLAFGEPQFVYYYLEMVCPVTRSKRKPLEAILTDTLVTPEFRKKAERAIYKQYISTDGVHVKMMRSAMVKHFVKTYCKSLTDYDVFFQQYHEWLNTLGIGDNPTLTIESRTYENKLNQCDYVLWSQWGCFRYYNIPEHDFTELLSTLDLEQFEDTELSTLKLFRDYSALMQQYDVHDEYELHNLLKKIWPSENGNVKFKKMPTIEIGNADHANQVLSLLLQYAPITADDLATRYEEEYGVKASTVRGSYLHELAPYFYNGVYSVDYAALPAIQFNRMKAILVRDFYTIQEARRLYKREFPNSDEALFNPYTMKTLGFHVYPGYSGYIIKNIFSGATDYFNTILTRNDIVDMREYDAKIRNIATYDSEHRRLRNAYEIVEFSPLQYINIRRLNEAGVTKECLVDYCKAVAANYEKGEYFTMASLRKDGFVHKLDDLGFDEWFYSSILFEDRERFTAQRIGSNRLFVRGNFDCNLGKLLIWLLEKYQKIDIYDLLELLQEYYGIHLQKEKITEIINGTDLYYDTIMEAVYIDYNTYFEEI